MFDEFYQLDLLTLKEITEDAGATLDEGEYIASLADAQNAGLLFEHRVDDKLLGYASLRDLGGDVWFVLMFNTHPSHRTRTVFMGLFRQLIGHLQQHKATQLKSNVFKNNVKSVMFHRHLGFRITRENEVGCEFTLDIDDELYEKWKTWR